MIGFRVSSNIERNIYLSDGCEDSVFCNKCGGIFDLSAMKFQNKIQNSSSDVFITMDGVEIFKSSNLNIFNIFCKIHEIVFCDYMNKYFFIEPREIIKFDVERRGAIVQPACDACGLNPSAYKSEPVFLKVENPLKKGIYRTDIYFGDPSSRHALLIVDIETGQMLQDAKLKGLRLEPVYGMLDDVVTKTGFRFPPTQLARP